MPPSLWQLVYVSRCRGASLGRLEVPSGGAVDDEWRSRGASLLRSVRAVAVRSISAARWGGGALCDYVSRVKNNTKIQNERAFCKKKREFLPTILRSENFALKVAKPFVSGRFSKGRKRSEIGRKKFEIWVLVIRCWLLAVG